MVVGNRGFRAEKPLKLLPTLVVVDDVDVFVKSLLHTGVLQGVFDEIGFYEAQAFGVVAVGMVAIAYAVVLSNAGPSIWEVG